TSVGSLRSTGTRASSVERAARSVGSESLTVGVPPWRTAPRRRRFRQGFEWKRARTDGSMASVHGDRSGADRRGVARSTRNHLRRILVMARDLRSGSGETGSIPVTSLGAIAFVLFHAARGASYLGRATRRSNREEMSLAIQLKLSARLVMK